MKYALLGIGIIVVALLAYWGIRFLYLVSVSKGLVQDAVPFELNSDNEAFSLLVLGDSTADGVGAGSPEESVPGRVASYVHATYVENHAFSGAVVADLPGQIAEARRTRYDLILIQAGANDIVRFHGAEATAEELASAVKRLPEAGQVVVISAGDVGSSRLFPLPLRPFYTRLNLAYHAAFARTLAPLHATYVNLYTAPGNDLFTKDPATYFAADGFHPSAAGYGIWFNAVRPGLKR